MSVWCIQCAGSRPRSAAATRCACSAVLPRGSAQLPAAFGTTSPGGGGWGSVLRRWWSFRAWCVGARLKRAASGLLTSVEHPGFADFADSSCSGCPLHCYLVDMRATFRWLIAVPFTIGIAVGGCADDVAPAPITDGNDSGGGDGAPECTGETGKLAKDDSESCCPGLFKSCPSISNDPKPCICSSVECGTEEQQPPPNVNCCPGVSSDCTSAIGSNQTICVCGHPRDR